MIYISFKMCSSSFFSNVFIVWYWESHIYTQMYTITKHTNRYNFTTADKYIIQSIYTEWKKKKASNYCICEVNSFPDILSKRSNWEDFQKAFLLPASLCFMNQDELKLSILPVFSVFTMLTWYTMLRQQWKYIYSD